MPTPINTILTRLADRLAQETFSPALRLITLAPAGPPAAYPHLAVVLEGERFGPAASDCTAQLKLIVSCAAGRPLAAQDQARALAHQLRVALNHLHELGPYAKRIITGAIGYATEEPHSDRGVVARAEVAAEVRYSADALSED